VNLKTVLSLFILTGFSVITNAQVTSSEHVLGTSYILNSEALQDEREIQVFIPEGYEKSEKEYPVLYLLDGQRLFPFGVSILKSFTQFKQTPEFIVVGITNSYPQRFRHFTDEEKKFLHFMEQDVIPFVDTNFRTTDERLLFGWEYGGSFVIQTMLDSPGLYSSYLAASPFPIAEKIKDLDHFLSENRNFEKSLYFSVSPNENSVNVGTEKLDSLLKLKAPKNMNWTYKKLISEEHRSTPYATIYHGLKEFYFYYPELQFNSLNEFTKAGGLSYVYKYCERRAEQFDFDSELSDWTKFTLIRNAIRADDYEQFQVFISSFVTRSFIEELRGRRPYELTDFYIKNQKYDEALNIYKVLLDKRSNSKELLNKLGELYLSTGNGKEAESYFKMAKELPEN